MEIEILRFRKIDSNNPNLKALVDLKIGEVRISEFKLAENSVGELVLLAPRITFKDRNTGALIHKSIVGMPTFMWDEITKKVLQAFREENNG